jgi:hypothetical protein
VEDLVETRVAVRAPLNFAADRTNGGIWSNNEPARITQALKAAPVEIQDARRLSAPPSLADEGFELHCVPLENADWADPKWIADVYIPQTADLVRRLTGARHATPFGSLIRDTGDSRRAPAAEFVHLDQTRESAVPFIEMTTPAEIRRSYPRVKIFNAWRPLTPPPQDVPLALCDQRTLDEADWVVGRTVEPDFPDGIPYITSVFNPRQRWFYISDLTPDDVIVFKGYDAAPDAPMGCMHGAFRQPNPSPGATPRASMEVRVIAFFDA